MKLIQITLSPLQIRFRYEVYPQTAKQASRFKLLVNNIEMRDRVSASEINKFLVKLVDKEHPMQSSAYMVSCYPYVEGDLRKKL